jgi:hypothetical protein
MEERTILCRTVFGSKLYGTDTPESDTDYKSVFMPTAREILTGQIPKTINMTTGKNNSRNGADDVDHESFSLHYFMQLLYQGQTVALDMLHGNKEEISTPIWKYLKTHRHEFYTKNMKAFVGYARKQAAKYGVKGSRLDAAREALSFLITKGDRTIQHLYEHSELWEGEHIHLSLYTLPDGDYDITKSYWEVCGKKMTFGGKASHYVDMLKKFYDNYGGRAKLAAANEGIDWKAISHAFRVAFQTQMILSGDGFKYPLPQTEYLRKVKAGKLDYTTEVAPYLDSLMDVIEAQSRHSELPDKVKVESWQNWLTAMTLDHIKKEVLGNVKC